MLGDAVLIESQDGKGEDQADQGDGVSGLRDGLNARQMRLCFAVVSKEAHQCRQQG